MSKNLYLFFLYFFYFKQNCSDKDARQLGDREGGGGERGNFFGNKMRKMEHTYDLYVMYCIYTYEK